MVTNEPVTIPEFILDETYGEKLAEFTKQFIASLASVSRSKFGPHIGEPPGNVLRFGNSQPRFIKVLDSGQGAGAINTIVADAPSSKIVYRQDYINQGQFINGGYNGGVQLANQQLAALRAAGVYPGKVLYVEGLNEVVASGDDHTLVMACSLGHADTILAAGLIPIEFNIACGNVEQADAVQMAAAFQYLWSRGALVGYHGYWEASGPGATWEYLAGRYQQITLWLRAAGVTAPALWAITEAGWDNLIDDQSGPIWTLIEKGWLSEAQAFAQMLDALARYNADPTVVMVTPFTFWHQGTPEWRLYDLAVRRNGQEWTGMLDTLANHLVTPGTVNDPATTPPPPVETRLRVKATSTPYANIRTGPGLTYMDFGDLEPLTVVTPIATQTVWIKVLVESTQGAIKQRMVGWVSAALLEPLPPSDDDEQGATFPVTFPVTF